MTKASSSPGSIDEDSKFQEENEYLDNKDDENEENCHLQEKRNR